MKPRLVSSLVSTFVAVEVKNPKLLLCYGLEAVRVQLLEDKSEIPNAPDWNLITKNVTEQLAKEFGAGITAKLLDAETDVELAGGAGEVECDTVCLKITTSQVPMSLEMH